MSVKKRFRAVSPSGGVRSLSFQGKESVEKAEKQERSDRTFFEVGKKIGEKVARIDWAELFRAIIVLVIIGSLISAIVYWAIPWFWRLPFATKMGYGYYCVIVGIFIVRILDAKYQVPLGIFFLLITMTVGILPAGGIILIFESATMPLGPQIVCSVLICLVSFCIIIPFSRIIN